MESMNVRRGMKILGNSVRRIKQNGLNFLPKRSLSLMLYHQSQWFIMSGHRFHLLIHMRIINVTEKSFSREEILIFFYQIQTQACIWFLLLFIQHQIPRTEELSCIITPSVSYLYSDHNKRFWEENLPFDTFSCWVCRHFCKFFHQFLWSNNRRCTDKISFLLRK